MIDSKCGLKIFFSVFSNFFFNFFEWFFIFICLEEINAFLLVKVVKDDRLNSSVTFLRF